MIKRVLNFIKNQLNIVSEKRSKYKKQKLIDNIKTEIENNRKNGIFEYLASIYNSEDFKYIENHFKNEGLKTQEMFTMDNIMDEYFNIKNHSEIKRFMLITFNP